MVQKKDKSIILCSNFSLLASIKEQNSVIVALGKDLLGFLIRVTAKLTTGSSLSNEKKLTSLINEIRLAGDKAGNLFTAIRGEDLIPLSYIRTGGVAPTESTISTSDQTDVFFLPWRVDETAGDALSMQLVAGSYNDGATGANGGILDVQVVPLYADDKANDLIESVERIQIIASGAGTENLAAKLMNKAISFMHITMDETKFDQLTFRRGNEDELVDYKLDEVKAYEKQSLLRFGGHKTNVIVVPFDGTFIGNPNTRFDVKVNGAVTMQLFVISPKPNK